MSKIQFYGLRPPAKKMRTEIIDWGDETVLIDLNAASGATKSKFPIASRGPIAWITRPNLNTVATEGPTERLVANAEWAARRPLRIVSQPETALISVGRRYFRYTPDFLSVLADRQIRVEAKGATPWAYEHVREKLRAVHRAYAGAGLEFEVAHASLLYNSPFAGAVNFISLNRHRLISDEREAEILAALADGPVPLGDLLTRAPSSLAALGRDLAALHARGKLTISLDGKPNEQTLVSPGALSVDPPWEKRP